MIGQQHIVRTFVVIVGRQREPIFQKCQVDAHIVGSGRFPGEVSDDRRCLGITRERGYGIADIADRICRSERRLVGIIAVDPFVAEFAVRDTEFAEIEPVFRSGYEVFRGKDPSGGS